ncbi:MAG TPA: alanine dehydrogenase [Saprospiraceae bacterium]|nr:alanine dehydrogenase [Saprospiraceae bacterium]
MGNDQGKIAFSDFFTKGQYEILEERLAVQTNKSALTIGIPNEICNTEKRVALVPNSIRSLIGYGYEIVVESGAGKEANFADKDYADAGAKISYSRKEVLGATMVIKASPATMDDLADMPGSQILISPLHIPKVSKEYIEGLCKKKITAMAMEYMQTDKGSFPIVRILSEIAGMFAIIKAGELLSNPKTGRGILLGGVSGVPPAKIVVLGAGVVGEYATKTALGFGASLRIFDNDINKIMRLQSAVGRQLHTSSINPVYLAYQLMSADVVIGAMHSKSGRTPILVTEEMVSRMKEGSVIIDVSIDQGGCFETSEITNLEQPTFVKHGVVHYCVPNIASQVSRTSSTAVSNIITPIIVNIGESHNLEQLLFQSTGLRNGCYTYKGHLTNEYLAKRFDIKYTDFDLILTSGF